MATYLADRVIVFEGQPAIAATATPYGGANFWQTAGSNLLSFSM